MAFNNAPTVLRDSFGLDSFNGYGFGITENGMASATWSPSRTPAIIDGPISAMIHFNLGSGTPAVIGPGLTGQLMAKQRAGDFPVGTTRTGFDLKNDPQLAATLGQVTIVNDGTQTWITNNWYAFPWTNVDPITGEISHYNAPLSVVFTYAAFWTTPYPLNGSWPTQAPTDAGSQQQSAPTCP